MWKVYAMTPRHSGALESAFSRWLQADSWGEKQTIKAIKSTTRLAIQVCYLTHGPYTELSGDTESFAENAFPKHRKAKEGHSFMWETSRLGHSKGSRGGNLNISYLTYSMMFSGQLVSRSVLYHAATNLVIIHWRGGMESFAGRSRKSEPRMWYRMHSTAIAHFDWATTPHNSMLLINYLKGIMLQWI